MARTLIIAFEKVLLLFSRKSSKRHGDLNFWDVKNAWKSSENYEFWPAPRTIHTPRSGIQMGAQNHAKWRQNASKITAKSAQKNMHAAVAMVKNARRRLTCKNASNCVNFCPSRCCFAHAMDAKIVQNRRKFITKWPQKIRGPVWHWSKTRAVDWPAKMYRNAFIFVAPGVALLSPWMQNRSKSSKIIDGGIRSIQNQRNSSKSWKITQKTIKKFQSTINNAPKLD